MTEPRDLKRGESVQQAVLMVNLTSVRNKLEEPVRVEIRKGEDRRVTKDSQVAYTKARIVTLPDLRRELKGRPYKFASAAYGKVAAGMEEFVRREECPPRVRDFYLGVG